MISSKLSDPPGETWDFVVDWHCLEVKKMGIACDIAIVVLALESIVIGVLLAILVIQVIRLVRMLRQEVLPILNSTRETVGTVRGTATFVSDHVIQPVVKASSYSAGVRQAVSTLFGQSGKHGQGRSKER